MQKFFSTLLILVSFSAFSQELTPVFEDTVFERNELHLSSFNYYSSNRFNNDLMDKFIFGGEITTEIKDRSEQRLGRINSFGAEAEQRIDFFNGDINPLGRDQYGMIISFSDNHLVSSNIASDLFRTVMYGNTDYVGDTMDFSFSHLQYLHFQKFGVGFFEKRTRSYIQVNFVAGSKEVDARLNDSWMVSQPDSVFLNLNGTGVASDRFYPYWAFQGSGVSLDMNYNFLFQNKKGNQQILNLKINNLGVIFWNPFTSQYRIDSLSTYTGFDINEILNRPEDETRSYNFFDTLGLEEATGKTITTMPVEFTLQKLPIITSDQKLQYMFGFKTILTSDYVPYVFGGLFYKPIDNFAVSSRLSYGGFGGFKWGLNLNYWIKDRVSLALGTFDVMGGVSGKFGYGRSVNFSAGFKL